MPNALYFPLLAERGWITLPQRRAPSQNRHRLAAPPERAWETEPVTGNLWDLGTVGITEVSSQPEGRAEVRAALAKFHYLGYLTCVGESSLGKAVSYFPNEYDALTGYLKSGTYEIDTIISSKTRSAFQPLAAAAGSSSGIPTPVGAVP